MALTESDEVFIRESPDRRQLVKKDAASSNVQVALTAEELKAQANDEHNQSVLKSSVRSASQHSALSIGHNSALSVDHRSESTVGVEDTHDLRVKGSKSWGRPDHFAAVEHVHGSMSIKTTASMASALDKGGEITDTMHAKFVHVGGTGSEKHSWMEEEQLRRRHDAKKSHKKKNKVGRRSVGWDDIRCCSWPARSRSRATARRREAHAARLPSECSLLLMMMRMMRP